MPSATLDVCSECSSPPIGLRERQRIARNEAILDAAFELIADKGYVALTMDELADKVGISRPTLYHHFPNKEAIALKALIRISTQSADGIRRIDSALPPIKRLEAVVRWILVSRFSKTCEPFVRAREHLLPIKSRPEYLAVYERRSALIREIVEDAQDAGDVNRALPSALVVEMLIGFMGSAHYEDLIDAGEVTREQVIESIVATFLNGVRPQ